MKTKNVWLLLLALVVIALELQPTGAVLRFGNPGGEPFRETFSYFSLVPFGYANFAPLLTAVTSVILTVILVLELFFDRRGLRRTALVLSFVAFVPWADPLRLFQLFRCGSGDIPVSGRYICRMLYP